jgi:hypothetical protein
MKLQKLLNEAVDQILKSLVDKHNLKLKPNGKAVEDFNYTEDIGKEFKEAGYELNYNSKKNHFDITSNTDAKAKEQKQKMIDARRASGFNDSGTARTSANVGGRS